MTDMPIQEFLGSKNNKLKDISILIGNGLGKSNPTHKQAFEFDPDYIFEKLFNELKTEYSDNPNSFQLKKTLRDRYNCPEKFFKAFRVEMLFISLLYYIDQLQSTPIKSPKLTQFLKNFNAIFTINYDPIVYWNIVNADKETNNFVDGFQGNKPISASQIEKTFDKYKTKIPIYYLHGAFHIFEKISDTKKYFKKVPSSVNETLLSLAEEEFKKILQNFRSSKESSEIDATCVMASRSLFKKAWIEEDPYLNLCFKKFKLVKKLLIFGCSFTNDHHLLDAIRRRDLEELYICYKDDNHRTSLEEIFKNNNITAKTGIKWINSGQIDQIIWQDKETNK